MMVEIPAPPDEAADAAAELLGKARRSWFNCLRPATGVFALAGVSEFLPPVGPRIGDWAYLSLAAVLFMIVYIYLITPWACRLNLRFIANHAEAVEKRTDGAGTSKGDAKRALAEAFQSYWFARTSGLTTAVLCASVAFMFSGIWPILYTAAGVYLAFLLEFPTRRRTQSWLSWASRG